MKWISIILIFISTTIYADEAYFNCKQVKSKNYDILLNFSSNLPDYSLLIILLYQDGNIIKKDIRYLKFRQARWSASHLRPGKYKVQVLFPIYSQPDPNIQKKAKYFSIYGMEKREDAFVFEKEITIKGDIENFDKQFNKELAETIEDIVNAYNKCLEQHTKKTSNWKDVELSVYNILKYIPSKIKLLKEKAASKNQREVIQQIETLLPYLQVLPKIYQSIEKGDDFLKYLPYSQYYIKSPYSGEKTQMTIDMFENIIKDQIHDIIKTSQLPPELMALIDFEQ